jgi:hypothetical protein
VAKAKKGQCFHGAPEYWSCVVAALGSETLSASVAPAIPAIPAADASATAPEDPTGGLGLHAHHRPVFNVFLDAMTGER